MSDRDGNEEIYVMRPDGSELRNLTNHEATDSFPSWSPDGARIAFQSARDGTDQIYVMNVDGTDVKKLTDTPNKKNMTAWSPDGQQIAFGAAEGTDVFIHVVNAAGGDPKKLTDGMAPSWSPDGKTLAFNRGQFPHIWLMDADGGNARRHGSGDLSGLSPQDKIALMFTLMPVWSPAGDRILYTKVMTEPGAVSPTMNYEVFTVSREGFDRKRLTDNVARDMANDWSPDARRIVFTSQRDGNAEVYVMNADGTGQENLTRHEDNDLQAAWSPFVGK